MNENWYISVNQQNYGPYTIEQLREMTTTGQLTPDTLVYHSEIGQWVKAKEVKGIFEQAVASHNENPNNLQPSLNNTGKKKKSGCLKGCLVFVLILALLIAGIWFMVFRDKPEKNLKTEKAVVLEEKAIDTAGGVVEVSDSESMINGLKIEINKSSYSNSKKFKISTRQITSHRFGDKFTPITPLITIENGGETAKEPMLVTIPIQVAQDEFAMAFYYTKQGKLEAMPLIYQDNTKLIVATKHFTDIVATKIKLEDLKNLDIDSGFKPKVDDWSFVNYGSQISPGGHCAGQVASMAYYYFEKKLKGEASLYTRFDNNHDILKTPAFDRDDSIGIRLASVVQREGNWNGYYFDYIYEYIHKNQYLSEAQIYYSFAYAMLLTGEPQLMGIYVREQKPNETTLESGHAILAYRITKDRIMVADPNFPGKTELYIPFDGQKIGPYISKTAADEPDLQYNSFSLLGKTALFDWDRVGELFKEAEKSAQESKIGDEYFGGTVYSAIVDVKDNGETIKVSNPELIVYDELAKNRVKAKFKDYSDVPRDWLQKDYLIVQAGVGTHGKSVVAAYRGTKKLMVKEFERATNQIMFIPLEKGVNNIGFYFLDKTTTTVNNQAVNSYDFVDFQRVKVENGKEDLTGVWQGDFQITDAGNLQKYAQGLGELITKWFLSGIMQALDKEMPSDEEIKRAVEEGIEVNEEAFEPMPIKLELSKIDDENYSIKLTVTTDEEYTYQTKAKYNNGVLKFNAAFEDGSNFKFKYYLYDNNVLAGEFEVGAYGMLKAVSGDSVVTR